MEEVSEYPRVLLAAPTSFVKAYCFWDWFLCIKTLTYPNLDILIVDNSPGTEYFEYLQKTGLRVLHVEPGNRTTQQYITESQNLIRDIVLTEGYDYFFSLESDVFPMVPDMIERLMVQGKDVITAPYFIGQGDNSQLLIGYLVKSFVIKNAVFGIILSQKYGFFLIDGTVKPVNQSGIGCTLIHRDILDQVAFRVEKGKVAHSDSYFFTDLTKMGIVSFLSTDCHCDHRNQDWGLIHNTWREHQKA